MLSSAIRHGSASSFRSRSSSPRRSPAIASAPNKAERQKLINSWRALTLTVQMADYGGTSSSPNAQRKQRASLLARRAAIRSPAGVTSIPMPSSRSCSRVSVNPHGRAGVIVPTGIATDSTTLAFSPHRSGCRRLVSFHDFQTGRGFFDSIGHARFKFSLLTLAAPGAGPTEISFSFFSRTAEDFVDERRHFEFVAGRNRRG